MIKNRIYKSELIDWSKVKDLQPENAKLHYNISYLRNSILKYGIAKAYDVCELDGCLYWLDGHTRTDMLRTLESEGIKIPKLLMGNFCNVESRKEAIEILIEVHNQKHNPFNENVLMEWIEIESVEVNIESVNVQINESEEEINLEAVEDDFDATPPEEPITVLGDLYEIGEHRLLCGDSTDSDQVAKLMNGEKADMVFTDPPYNINYGNIKHPKSKQRDIENDNMSGADFKDFCNAFVSNIKLFCDGVVYCWAGPGKDGRIMFTALDEALHNSTMIVWNKDQFTLGRGKYQNKNEVCWFGWNLSGETFTDNRTLPNVWDIERPKKSELHPTMKPIKLIENALLHNPKAKSVLDLFLGSGTTMVASHQLKRKCYGMELDPKYCDVIIRRMLKLDTNLIIKKNGKIINKELFSI